MTSPPEGPIVFFDGECSMCDACVDFVLRRDRAGVFRFAPLQGNTARATLPAPAPDPSGWSVILRDEAGVHERSDAVLRILARLGGVWTIASWARVVPRFARDAVYRFVARNRYRWFGKKETCRMPTPEERGRILD